MESSFKCVQPATPGSFFLAGCIWSSDGAGGGVKQNQEAKKQTNKQLGRFLPPSWAFFPSVLNTLHAMIITNIRAQDGAQGRAFAGSTFLEPLGNALPGECSRNGGSRP